MQWPTPPTDEQRDLLLADLDEFAVSAIDDVDDVMRVFFATTDARDHAASVLAALAPTLTISTDMISDENWAERSQASITAVRVGSITVAPPWAVPADDSTVIVIQPSMGFGTAHHESTRLCLGLLQQPPSLAGLRVFDVGTGSGVLALAALRLGAAEVLAADYDADAIESARENLELNDAESAIDLLQMDLIDPSPVTGRQFDVLFANLTGGVLIRFAQTLASFAAPGSTLITSGVTLQEDDAVADALTRAGFSLVLRETEREWVGASWRRAADAQAPAI